MEALIGLLPLEVEEKLAAITIRETEEEKDKWCWGYNKDESYGVSSAYKVSSGDLWLQENKEWQ